MHQQTIQRIAYAYPACLSIHHYGYGLLQVGIAVHIGMNHSGTGLYNRHTGIVAHIIDKTLAAAGNNQIHITDGLQQGVSGLMAGEERYRFGRQSMTGKHFVNQFHNGLATIFGIASALEHTGASCLQAKCETIETHIGTGFEDDSYDAKRHTDACQFQTIRQDFVLEGLAQWRGQGGHLAQVGRNVAQTVFRKPQAVISGIRLIHPPEVLGICLKQAIHSLFCGIGQVCEYCIYLVCRQDRQRTASGMGRRKYSVKCHGA